MPEFDFHTIEEMVPLPAVALELSNVFPPAQNDALPLTLAVGFAFTVTAKGIDVVEQLLLFVTTTV